MSYSKRRKKVVRDATTDRKQAELDKTTRKVALAFAFVSVFYFFIKLLFL